MEPKCNRCGYDTAREDGRVPLMIMFKDNDEDNQVLENLEILCYNCYFQAWDERKLTPRKITKNLDRKDSNKFDGVFEDDKVKELEAEISGDELMQELGSALADIFKKT